LGDKILGNPFVPNKKRAVSSGAVAVSRTVAYGITGKGSAYRGRLYYVWRVFKGSWL